MVGKPLSIIVVGSGTAGLCCTVALAKKGHKVTCIERSPSLRISGGAYRLGQNAMQVLRSLGVLEELEKSECQKSSGFRTRRYQTGEVLYTVAVDSGPNT